MNPRDALKHDRRRFLQLASAAAGVLAFNGLALAQPAGGKMKIGIVGAGKVGGTLGTVWAKAGHEVMFSSLDIEQDKALAARVGARARAGTPREAAAFGDVVLVSVPYGALPAVGKDLRDLIKGKVVIDTCNPFVNRDGEIATWARQKGAGDASKELLPGARIVRAFNAIGYARMGEAHQQPGKVGMPIAGDDPEAIKVASALIRDIGFEPVLIGPLVRGKHLMPGTPLAGERSPDEIRKIAATLD